MVYSGYTAVYLAATLASALACAFAWKRRFAPGGRWLCAMSASTTFWALTEALDFSSTTLSAHLLWAKLSYLGATTAPVFLFLFVQAYKGRTEWGRPRVVAALLVVPALAVAAAFTNELHHLVWPSLELFPGSPHLIVYEHGAAYWVVTVYGLVLSLVASAQLFLIAVRARTLYRAQSVAVIIAVLVPWCAELAYSLAPGALPGIDPALSLAFASTVLAFAMLRFRLLDVVPIPREILVEQMTDGLLVLDRDARVLEINPAGARLLGIGRTVHIGEPLADLLVQWPDAAEAMLCGLD